MYFDLDGSVLACCQNVLHPLGDVRRDRLEDIWRGRPAADLRERLAAGDLGGGCESCAASLRAGDRTSALAATFDPFEPQDWPVRLEFALSNRCNLACIQCNGTSSSRIRAERDGLPPLPSVYGPDFFEQLRPFLRHVRQCRFFGGEPFLIPEYRRVWDLMIEEGSTAECNVTTNGTVWTPSIQRYLAALPFSIGVSVDGATRGTVESIRVGAVHDQLLANIGAIARYCEQRGTWFGLTYCLMTVNWHELADFLRWADGLGAEVAVNRVVQPSRFSLLRLGADELATVVDGLRRHDADLAPLSDRNRAVWAAQLRVLEHRLDELRAGDGAGPAAEATVRSVLAGAPFRSEADARAALAGLADGPPQVLRVDTDGRLSGTGDGQFFDVAEADLAGRPMSAVAAVLGERFGPAMTMVVDGTEAGTTARVLSFTDGERATQVLVVTLTTGEPPGQAHVAVVLTDGTRAARTGTLSG
jgi:MoaA/NifB/PqqE/SkfB family radical SAM enzyme